MARTSDQFRSALRRLEALGDAVARRERREEVEDALTRLRVAILSAYGPRPRASRGAGARAKISSYLKEHLGEWVEGEELAVVSGIGEWARRVRELRVEDGYDIDEEAGRYRLNVEQPDQARASRWVTANTIRRQGGGARDRIAAFLAANVGVVVTRDEIDYVANIKEGSRRVRELRDEQGWPIESNIDDRALKPGHYRLVSADPADRRDPRQRLYPEDLRAQIFRRDNYTCEICGRDRQTAERAGDRRFYLEVHHRHAVADQLDALPAGELNDPTNLITLCHDDHLRLTAEFQRKRRRTRGSGYSQE